MATAFSNWSVNHVNLRRSFGDRLWTPRSSTHMAQRVGGFLHRGGSLDEIVGVEQQEIPRQIPRR